MNKRLYLKLILSYVAVGILGFLFVATVSSRSIYRYLARQKASALYQETHALASECSKQYSGTLVSLDAIKPQLAGLAAHLESQIWIMDRNGRVTYDTCSEASHVGQTFVDFDPAATMTMDNYRFQDFHGSFREPVLTASAPITGRFSTYGYVLIHMPESVVLQSRYDLLNIVYVAYLAVFLLSLLVLLTFQLTVYLPIRKITRAANEYASGNLTYRLNLHSSDELGYLASTLDYMAMELYNSEEYQKKFIANVSHDFRSPLTSIKGYIEAMLDGTIPPENQERYLNIVISETERLNKLTESLLTLNSLDEKGQQLMMTDFDINQVIKNTCATFEGSCSAKGITVDLTFSDKTLMVHADMGKIQQVIYNLVDNAIKFSHHDSVIWIEAYDQHEKIFVSVKDSGIGIPKNCTGKIWERFYKTDLSRGKDKRGTGLGLSITKEIIQAHNENIDVISTEGVGTEFIFTLQRAAGESG